MEERLHLLEGPCRSPTEGTCAPFCTAASGSGAAEAAAAAAAAAAGAAAVSQMRGRVQETQCMRVAAVFLRSQTAPGDIRIATSGALEARVWY